MKRAWAMALVGYALCIGQGHATPVETNTITLAEGFQKVLARDGELLRLRQDVERAAGTKLDFHARDLGSLRVEPTAGLQGGSLYGKDRPFALVTAEFSQPLFNTAIAANWRRGNLEVLAAEQNLNVAIANRLHEFRSYYTRAQRLEQLIALYEQLDQRLQANVTAEQQRHDAGSSGPRPLLQARVQLLSEQAELTAFRREDFDVRSAMAEMMREKITQPPHPAELLSQATTTFDLKTQTELAQKRRADLQVLRTLIRMLEEDRRFVEAGYFPYLSAIGSTLYLPGKRRVYQVTPIIEGQQPLGTDIRGGASLTWQIVDNGRVTGQRRQVEGVRQEYKIILRQLEENIPRELEREAHSLENATAKLVALEKSTAAADENLRLIESRISLGEGTQLDFSDAQRNLLAVRRNVVEALFQQAQALAELDQTTGRYLEFAEPVKEP